MYSFTKNERLTSQLLIDKLFESNHSFVVSPLKVLWINAEHPGKYPVQIAISVPKKKFKRAVDRNLLKRRIREAYRKNKSILYDFLNENNKKCLVILIYNSQKELTYQEIESKIILVLHRLIQENGKIS